MSIASFLQTRSGLYSPLKQVGRYKSPQHASISLLKPTASDSAFLRSFATRRPKPKATDSLRASHTAAKRHPIPHPSTFHAPVSPTDAIHYLDPPFHNLKFIQDAYVLQDSPMNQNHIADPKSAIANFSSVAFRENPTYDFAEGWLKQVGRRRTQIIRCTVKVPGSSPVVGIGDHTIKKEARRLASLSAAYQLHALGILDNPKLLRKRPSSDKSVRLSDGAIVDVDIARSFMDFYCRKYGFEKPTITLKELKEQWEAVMNVGGRRIGLGYGPRKIEAEKHCYLDVTKYLEECDPELWKSYVEARKTGADLGLAPKVFFQMSNSLDDNLRDLVGSLRGSQLYENRLLANQQQVTRDHLAPRRRKHKPPSQHWHHAKSRILSDRRQESTKDPTMYEMRSARLALPVYTRAQDLVRHINANDVTICMAATGSGKTTQIPQIVLDSFIDQGEGSRCNIICTQPRRLAAISVAQRVAKERGEPLGKSVGFQVRFEHKFPEEHGSITFCTVGTLLRRLQSNLSDTNNNLENVTHIIVDEVHERDVDTDLLLVVLKRLMADRKVKMQPLKVILMSATFAPSLFQNYFPTDAGEPAKVIDIPGRSFPVTHSYLEDFLSDVASGPQRWILSDEDTVEYISKEIGHNCLTRLGCPILHTIDEPQERDADVPHVLIGAIISHVLQQTDDGHVLVFLPGWDDILKVQRLLETPPGPLNVDFNDQNKVSVHLLHSTVPLNEQQVIFEPARKGLRRIILATNIAETSVTIPDVVYVVDSARVKEQQYDPVRRITSLVSAWVGSSNLQQRAGRAGRHRPGKYFGLLGRQHAEALPSYQTVEINRIDLSNVVMHIKALNFPGLTVEEVLSATIEPPPPERVNFAIRDLHMAGALDDDNNLTSLGRVLLQLPVDVRIGRLVLYGCFFRCLDHALTLAALLSEREPFVHPIHLVSESLAKKRSWVPENFSSDTLAAVRAYDAWASMQNRGDYASANRFCKDNFLSKPVLLMVHRTRKQIIDALYQTGAIQVSAGGNVGIVGQDGIPVELNKNSDSLPLLSALLAIAAQSKFAVRMGTMTYRTSNDKTVVMHPKSVNFQRKRETCPDSSFREEKQLFAFSEKRQNISPGGPAQTFLVNTTRLDPLAYMLFGAYKIKVVDNGLECDNWIPVVGNLDALDDVQRVKVLMEECMLRVFQGITFAKATPKATNPFASQRESDLDEEEGHHALSRDEVRELDLMTHDIVRILNNYNEERVTIQSLDKSPKGKSVKSSHSLFNYESPVFGGTDLKPSRAIRRF